jgi:hypothetical protein
MVTMSFFAGFVRLSNGLSKNGHLFLSIFEKPKILLEFFNSLNILFLNLLKENLKVKKPDYSNKNISRCSR